MGMFAWVMMGLAIWHFTIWLPDRFWGGIVGAFLASCTGAVFTGLLLNGFSVPGNKHIELLTALDAVPGALLGIAAVYFEGVRRENAAGALPDGAAS